VNGGLPFDRVAVTDGGVVRRMTVEEFLAVPLHKRIPWVLEKRVVFSLHGEAVDPREAFNALRGQWGKAA
jgi:hypothetical protein